MSIEAMKLALEAMESAIKAGDWVVDGACDPDMALVALRQAIAKAERQSTHSEHCYKWHHACAIARIEQAEQAQPVAWMYVNTDGECEQIEYGEPFDDP